MSNAKFYNRALIYIALVGAAIIYLAPLYVIIVTSFKPLTEIHLGRLFAFPLEPTLYAWKKAWSEACVGVSCPGLKPFYGNSLKMTIPAVLFSTALGAINGFILTKVRFRGANLIFGLMLFGCFIPYQAIIIPLAVTLREMGVKDPTLRLVIIHTTYGLSFTTLFFRNFYVSFPNEIIRAAAVDGLGPLRTFYHIVLPSSLPIIAVSVIFQFTGVWNEFLFGSSFALGDKAPITVALNNITGGTMGVQEYNVHMAAVMLTALPTLLIYVLAGKYFMRGLMAGAVKG